MSPEESRSRPSPPARPRAIAVALLLLLPAAFAAPVVRTGPAVPAPAPETIRTGGRTAVQAWVAERSAADPTKRPAEVKAFEACLELALSMVEQAGGPALEPVLAEAAARLGPAQARAKDAPARARQVALLGELHERAAGDRRTARRHYEDALRLDGKDAVALAGLARLELAEQIDEHKEIEAERMRELEAEWAKQPRTRPPERSPLESRPTATPQP